MQLVWQPPVLNYLWCILHPRLQHSVNLRLDVEAMATAQQHQELIEVCIMCRIIVVSVEARGVS